MSAIQVSLVSAHSGKSQLVTLPRGMTVAQLQQLTGSRNVAYAVDGYAPAGSATLGDLYDMCAKQDALEIQFTRSVPMGCCIQTGTQTDGYSNSVSTGGSSQSLPNLDAGGALGGLGGGGNGLGGLNIPGLN